MKTNQTPNLSTEDCKKLTPAVGGEKAAFIVRCVNAHDALVSALQALVHHLENREDFIVEDHEEGEVNDYSRAINALKLAKKAEE